MSHTPFPWRVNGGSIVGPLGNTIAECFGYSVLATSPDQKRQGSREANAHIISAAPDMLAVLRQIVKDFNEFDEEQPSIFIERMMANCTDAECAIEKATGGAK